MSETKEQKQQKIINEFFKKINKQRNVPPEYQKLVSEHFWELIDHRPIKHLQKEGSDEV